jgi:leucyl-tRNA synthetase
VNCPRCSKPARRETDTMDTFVDSAWYQLRYCSPKTDKSMIDSEAVNYWCPVDIYIGGIEHAVGHLMYFRYFYKRLVDFGLIDIDKEPAKRLFVQGMVIKDGAKMSKSKGNVVDPNDMIEKYGADTTRMFSLFAAPPERDLEWNEAGVEGIFRFLNRVWNTVQAKLKLIKDADFPSDSNKYSQDEISLRRKTHQTIKKVTLEIDKRLHFNTAIAAVMELLNEVNSFDVDRNKYAGPILKEAIYNMIVLLSVFSPHIAEELYEQIGGGGFVVDHKWPEYNEDIAAEEMVTIVIQINGKLRGRIDMPVESDKKDVISMAKEEQKIAQYLEGMEVAKEVYVPNKLVNFVIKEK